MAVIGFSLSKAFIEKKEFSPNKKVEINSNINLRNVEKQDFKIVEGKDTLKVSFDYNIEYSPDIAKLCFEGDLVLVVDQKQTDEILKSWKKNNKLEKELRIQAYNAIFHKCNVKAFQLEDDFNLPLHIRLPTIKDDTE